MTTEMLDWRALLDLSMVARDAYRTHQRAAARAVRFGLQSDYDRTEMERCEWLAAEARRGAIAAQKRSRTSADAAR